MLSVPYFQRLIAVVLDGAPFLHVDRAIPLLLGVAAQESHLTYTRQLGGGPARGFFQLEPATERDHWRWLHSHRAMETMFEERAGVDDASVFALEHNLPYQILMARLHFHLRDPQPLPAADDLQGQAARWKQWYNTPAGAGTVEAYLATWQRLIQPYWPGPPTVQTPARPGARAYCP